MTRTQCPSEDELSRLVDSDLTPEDAGRVTEHLGRCQSCREQVKELRALVEVIGKAAVNDFDVTAHVRDVMRRIEQPRPQQKRPRVIARLATISALAASVGLITQVLASRRASMPGTWQARGNSSGESLSRDVGVQVYTLTESLQPLLSGDTIAPNAALTAGLRNLGHATAHVLLFAIDSRNAVHWIMPKYTRVDENPVAPELTRSLHEHLLPTSVVFDDIAPGPMRVVTLVSLRPVRVFQVESLTESELTSASLVSHFSGAEVREIIVQVRDANQGKAQ